MGSNNRLEGKVVERRATPPCSPVRLAAWGGRGAQRRPVGSDATGLVRLERVRMAGAAGENLVRLPLVTSMFLGDRWEHLFDLGDHGCAPMGRSPLSRPSSGSRSCRRTSGSSDPRAVARARLRPGKRDGLLALGSVRWTGFASTSGSGPRDSSRPGHAAEENRKGRVSVNEQVAKASRELREGDVVELRQAGIDRTLVVRGLTRLRGPAPIAQALYEETEASLERRARQAAERKLQAEPALAIDQGRPTKRDRRQLADWNRWSASAIRSERVESGKNSLLN